MAELLIKAWVTLLSLVVVMAIGLGCSALWRAATAFRAARPVDAPYFKCHTQNIRAVEKKTPER